MEPGLSDEAEDLSNALQSANAAMKEEFHNQFCRRIYDPEACGSSLDLAHKPHDVSLQEYVKSAASEFYTGLLDDKNDIDAKAWRTFGQNLDPKNRRSPQFLYA